MVAVERTQGPRWPAPTAAEPRQTPCPITLAPPRQAVSLPGEPEIYYEQDALERWLRRSPTSPVTRRAFAGHVTLRRRGPHAAAVHVELAPPRQEGGLGGRRVATAGGSLLAMGLLTWGLGCRLGCEVAMCAGMVCGLVGYGLVRRGLSMVDWAGAEPDDGGGPRP